MEGEIQQSAPAPASGFNAGYNMHPMNAPGSGGGAFEASAGSQNGEIGARRKPRRSKKRNAADRGFEIFKSVEGQNGAGGSSILNSLVGTELPDFTEAEEAELGPEFSTTFDAENSNPAAAKKPKLENYSVVYVHEGQRMRTAISNSVWNDVWHKCQTLVSDMILSRGTDTKIDVIWCGWKSDRGLIGCADKETVEFVKKVVAKVKIGEMTYKAWERGQTGLGSLVTMTIPATFNGINDGKLFKVILKQNEMTGSATGGQIERSGEERIIRFCADQVLLEGLGKLGGIVRLGLGRIGFKINQEEIDDTAAVIENY